MEYIPISPGNKIGAIYDATNQFTLSFDLKLGEINNSSGSILRLTSTSKDCCDYGDKWLAIWYEATDNVMKFSADNTQDGEKIIQVHDMTNYTTKVKVRGRGNDIDVFVNETKKGALSNVNRPLIYKIYVYASEQADMKNETLQGDMHNFWFNAIASTASC